MSSYRNVLLSTTHSRALLELGIREGLVQADDATERTARRKNATSLLTNQAADSLLLHEQIVLNIPGDGLYDLAKLDSEGVLATQPIRQDIPRIFAPYGGELEVESDAFRALAERAILFEPFLLREVWQYVMKMPSLMEDKRLFNQMRALPWATRRHVWRLGCLTYSNTALNDVYARQRVFLADSLGWWSKHQADYARYWEHAELGVFFGIVIAASLLSQRYEVAREHNACVLVDRRALVMRSPITAWVRDTAAASSKIEALATLRLVLGQSEANARRRQLSLREILTLRKARDIVCLREAVDQVAVAIVSGDRSAVAVAAREVVRAERALQRSRNFGWLSRISTYVSVPLSVAELLLLAPPVASLSIAAAGVAGQLGSDIVGQKHSWVTRVI